MSWRFYGRKREIRELREFMDNGTGFRTLAIRGRRQVGKTDLIRHFFANEYRKPKRPVIICHLALAGQDPSRFFGSLMDKVHRTGPELLEGFTPLESQVDSFPHLVRHLLNRDCTVVLDEFQRIAERDDWLASLFQNVVDDIRREHRASNLHSRLLVMGSEQQKLMDMFTNPKAAMYRRITEELHIQPWSFDDLLDMVWDQGWETQPERLLTMWTAWGGMPEYWERFVNNTDIAERFHSMEDRQWTDAFLAREERFRHMLDRDFASQMEIELRSVDRKVLAWLAERPRGQRLVNMPDSLCQALVAQATQNGRTGAGEVMVQAMLEDIVKGRLSGEHLGLVDSRNAIDQPDVARWYVSDNHARFHLDVLEKVARKVAGYGLVPTPGRIADMRRQSMAIAEGRGLETLTLSWLKHIHGVEDTFISTFSSNGGSESRNISLTQNAWRLNPRTEVDIMMRDDEADRLVFTCAKRSATLHRPSVDCQRAQELLHPGRGKGPEDKEFVREMTNLGQCPRGMLFVSRSFSDRDVETLEQRITQAIAENPAARTVSEWTVADIADMFANNPPRPVHISDRANEPEDTPEP